MFLTFLSFIVITEVYIYILDDCIIYDVFCQKLFLILKSVLKGSHWQFSLLIFIF